MMYLGNFLIGGIVRIYFTTNNKSGGREDFSASIEVADFRIYKNGVATKRSSEAGWTIDENVDSMVGVHCLSIDLSDDTDVGFYAKASEYGVILYPNDETIDLEDISHAWKFSIERKGTYNAIMWNGV